MKQSDSKQAVFTLYGGINVIGGTKLHVQSGESEVLFDFGSTFAPGFGSFDTVLRPRPGREVDDYMALGIIPNLPKLYAGSKEGHDLPVFISHFHLDHVGLLFLLDPSVPIYMSEPSYQLYQQLEVIGEGIGQHDDIRVFTYGQWIEWKSLRVLPLEVDHDIQGATGFFVETLSGTIAYTGDFRGHGNHPDKTEAFFQYLGAHRTHALISEGTRAGEASGRHTVPEKDMAHMLAKTMENRSAVFFTLYHRNIERIAAFAAAAQAVSRKLVLTPETLHLFRTLAPVQYEQSRPAVYVCVSQAAESLPSYLSGLDVQTVNAQELANDQTAFLVELPYEHLTELVDIQPHKGAIYIHSDGVPLGAYDPAYANVTNWLQTFGVDMVSVRSTGHADPMYLQACIEQANPDVLYATHTFHPEQMPAPHSGLLVVPHIGRSYPIAPISI